MTEYLKIKDQQGNLTKVSRKSYIEVETGKGRTLEDLSKELGISRQRVHILLQEILRERGIKRTGRPKKWARVIPEWIKLFNSEKETIYSIAKKYKVDTGTVYTALKKAGCNTGRAGKRDWTKAKKWAEGEEIDRLNRAGNEQLITILTRPVVE